MPNGEIRLSKDVAQLSLQNYQLYVLHRRCFIAKIVQAIMVCLNEGAFLSVVYFNME